MDTPDILFQYLKDIVYDTDNAKLELSELPEEFQQLGQGMQLFGTWMKETRQISLALAKGDLSVVKSDRENVIAGPVKDLQGTLRHLAWQTQQVAKGDYSQTVDFMGDFSDAFNTMTRQLQERRDALIKEKKRIQEKNKELEDAFCLAMAFANCNQNLFFIHSIDGKEELFKNKIAGWFLKDRASEGKILREALRQKDLEGIHSTVIWELPIRLHPDQEVSCYLSVESYPIRWRNQKALVHIVTDDTEQKRKENQMYHLAYADALTGAYNRRFAIERMSDWIRQGIPFVLSYIDVDYLKYYNDTYGHELGDSYLIAITESLNTLDGLLCRTGGDEFMILSTHSTASRQDQELERLRMNLLQDESAGSKCPRSFSYGSCEVPKNPKENLEFYISQVDSRMYAYKMRYKKPLADAGYRDDRNFPPIRQGKK